MKYSTILNGQHILIAGSTGSGKSVLLNNLIYNTLVNEKAQYIFIDPKRVELNQYKHMDSCLYYASESQEITQSLNYTLEIVDNRFKTMQQNNLKKYQGNRIYLIIDELADLMINSKENVKLLQRLLQIARASNTVIIGCTQCVNTKVIPTELRTNFGVRLGLRVQNTNESRMIINCGGLELLPKYGYCVALIDGYTTKFKVNMIDSEYIQHFANKHKKEKKAAAPKQENIYCENIQSKNNGIDYKSIVILLLMILCTVQAMFI